MADELSLTDKVLNPLLMQKSESFDEETSGKRDRAQLNNNYSPGARDIRKYGLGNEDRA